MQQRKQNKGRQWQTSSTEQKTDPPWLLQPHRGFHTDISTCLWAPSEMLCALLCFLNLDLSQTSQERGYLGKGWKNYPRNLCHSHTITGHSLGFIWVPPTSQPSNDIDYNDYLGWTSLLYSYFSLHLVF